jgi:hypothetical protein
VTQSDLITRLTIAKCVGCVIVLYYFHVIFRLLTIALHRTEVATDVWERAKELDEKRKKKIHISS